MKNTAVLINVSRGGIVDEIALFDALKEGTIWAAGLTYSKTEPVPLDNPASDTSECYGPLLAHRQRQH